MGIQFALRGYRLDEGDCARCRPWWPFFVGIGLLGASPALLAAHRIGTVATWRAGAWVSPGPLGSVDRMLRHRSDRF